MSSRTIDIDENGEPIYGEGISFSERPPELAAADLWPGDVLVWYSSAKSSIHASIREASGGPFSHAGIYIGDGNSIDAGPSGVHCNQVIYLQQDFAYGRVMRYQNLGPMREGQVVCAAVAAAAANKGYAWLDAITLPLRRASVYGRHRSFWKRSPLALPGSILLAMRKTPDPNNASKTFCSRMVLEAYSAASIFDNDDLQQCVWTPTDIAVIGGGFEYVGWLNHVAPPIPKWHPMDPYSPDPIGRYAKWKRNFLRVLSGSARHK